MCSRRSVSFFDPSVVILAIIWLGHENMFLRRVGLLETQCKITIYNTVISTETGDKAVETGIYFFKTICWSVSSERSDLRSNLVRPREYVSQTCVGLLGKMQCKNNLL